jgi:hypothetical protein
MKSEEILTVKYGTWNSFTGIDVFEANVWVRRSNFKGHNIQ